MKNKLRIGVLLLTVIISFSFLVSCDVNTQKPNVESNETLSENSSELITESESKTEDISENTSEDLSDNITEVETESYCTSHADSDDDGKCDTCNVSLVIFIDFYTINDLHGKFNDSASNIGVDELTAYLNKTAVIDTNTVFLSSGDMWQGSSESNLTKGLIITDWMNELEFVSMTLGNHEFDWGDELIEQNEKFAEFPFLAINIFDRSTNERVDYCHPSVIVERDGIQIGIIGAVGDCYSSIASDKSGNFYFKTGKDLTMLVKEESQRLRSMGVDFIVYSIHDGFEQNKTSPTYVSREQISGYYDTELSNGYVDLVFEGHTHQRYVLIDEYGVYHLQAGGDNKGISHVEIAVNSVTYTVFVTEASFVDSSIYSNFDGDPLRDELLEKYKDEIAKGDEVLGTISKTKYSSTIRKKVAELYYLKGLEIWGDEYKIVLGGAFLQTRSPYDLEAGTIKYSHLQTLLPFDNQLVLCSIKGSDLKSKFFETNNTNYYIYYGSYGESVKNNIDPSATYYIITDTYTSTYAYNNITEIMRLDEDIYARDLLAAFIKNGGWK